MSIGFNTLGLQPPLSDHSIPLSHATTVAYDFSETILQVLWKGAYLASVVTVKIQRLSRRCEHPYLYIAGALLHEHVGSQSLFLSSVAKVVRISRILHESLEASFQLHESLSNLWHGICSPISPVTLGYLYALRSKTTIQAIRSQSAPSFSYHEPMIAMAFRRAEIAVDHIKDIIGHALRISLKLVELWKTLSEHEEGIEEDVFIELAELYSMYKVSDPESLFFRLKKTAPFIEKTFHFFNIEISPTAFFQKLETVLQEIQSVERKIQHSINVMTQTAYDTQAIAYTAFGISQLRLDDQKKEPYPYSLGYSSFQENSLPDHQAKTLKTHW